MPTTYSKGLTEDFTTPPSTHTSKHEPGKMWVTKMKNRKISPGKKKDVHVPPRFVKTPTKTTISKQNILDRRKLLRLLLLAGTHFSA